MIQSELCLSVETLDKLSAGELPAATVRAIETHVDDCEHCRQLLGAVESDSQWRDEICPILRTGEDSTFRSADDAEQEHETQTLASILRLLGPTDDPHMLGRIGEYEIVSVIGRGANADSDVLFDESSFDDEVVYEGQVYEGEGSSTAKSTTVLWNRLCIKQVP